MALPSTIYRASLQLSDVDRGVYEVLQTTIARHPSETEERLVARVLAYALFYEPGLAFTKGVGAGDEPDLWLKEPDGRTALWVEVGLPESERILKASRHSAKVALVVCGRALPHWEQQHLKKMSELRNVNILLFNQLFINSVSAKLDRSINWDITISDNNLYINSGDETFETALQLRSGAR